jgi:hypothetical protein
MKKIAFIIILALPFAVFAQEFAPIGAIWHNTQGSFIIPDMITYKTIESVSDTIINGKQCKLLIEVERLYSDTVHTFIHYMYSENDSVFFFKDNEFHLLYDFGADQGDTLVLDYFLTYEGTPLLMIIDSTRTIDINGEERMLQHITCDDGILVGMGSPVIEGIGSTYFLFPTYDGTINGPLRCYQDGIIGLYINYFYSNYGWNYEDCDQIITDVEEKESYSTIVTYPNPASDRIFFKFSSEKDGIPKDFRMEIYNMFGQEVGESNISAGREGFSYDVSGLSNGIYIAVFRENQKIISNRKFLITKMR